MNKQKVVNSTNKLVEGCLVIEKDFYMANNKFTVSYIFKGIIENRVVIEELFSDINSLLKLEMRFKEILETYSNSIKVIEKIDLEIKQNGYN